MKLQNLRFSLLVMMAIFTLNTVNAQQKKTVTPFRKGTLTGIAGAGPGHDYTSYRSSHSAFGTKIAMEYGVWSIGPGILSVGAELGGTFSKNGYKSDYRGRNIVLAGRSAWHYGWKVDNLDTYGGFSLGVGFRNYDYTEGNSFIKDNDVIPVFGAFVGASYFLTHNFGINIEMGYDITAFQAGIVYKFQ